VTAAGGGDSGAGCVALETPKKQFNVQYLYTYKTKINKYFL